jgi:hypothetical protein
VKGRLTGRHYGLLTVQGVESVAGWGELRYWCRCECGRTSKVFAGNLRSGNTRSCGCLRKQCDWVTLLCPLVDTAVWR